MRFWPVYGGGETITVSLANEFVRLGHKVFVAYMYDKVRDPMPYHLSEKIISKQLHTIENYVHSDVVSLHDFIVDNKIDVMVNQWGCTKLCDAARKKTSCKLVTCWHLDVLQKEPNVLSKKDFIVKKLFGKFWFEKYFRFKQIKNHMMNLKLSDKYVFLSPSFVDDFCAISKSNLNRNKILAISNPLTYDIEYDMNIFNRKKKQVLFVGRIFEYHKRVSYVLDIWKTVEQIGAFDDWSLVIVGDGPDLSRMKALAKEMNLKKVFFEGFQNPQNYYEQSSLFVMTSAFEGFGMTLVEAQQYATVPLVMDSYKSLHDIVVDNENGIIVPNNDLKLFSERLQSLMVDNARRKELAENGLLTCKRFSVRTIAQEWLNLFGKIV